MEMLSKNDSKGARVSASSDEVDAMVWACISGIEAGRSPFSSAFMVCFPLGQDVSRHIILLEVDLAYGPQVAIEMCRSLIFCYCALAMSFLVV